MPARRAIMRTGTFEPTWWTAKALAVLIWRATGYISRLSLQTIGVLATSQALKLCPLCCCTSSSAPAMSQRIGMVAPATSHPLGCGTALNSG
jgi:hypothetical protein